MVNGLYKKDWIVSREAQQGGGWGNPEGIQRWEVPTKEAQRSFYLRDSRVLAFRTVGAGQEGEGLRGATDGGRSGSAVRSLTD